MLGPLTRAVPRRAVLLGTALGLLTTVSACTGGTPEPAPTSPAPTPDELAYARAVATTRSLLRTGESTRSSRSGVNRLLGEVQQVNAEHLAALGVSATPPTTTAATPSAAVTSSAQPATIPDLVTAHAAAAQEALDDVRKVSPGLATLLARLAAARALNAALLAAAAGLKAPARLRTAPLDPPASGTATSGRATSGTATSGTATSGTAASGTAASGTLETAVPSLSPAAEQALAAQLEGAHAAVYAYALIRAQLSGARGRLADAMWQEHRARRDRLETTLQKAGHEPPAAQPAYAVGQVRTADAAVALAVRVERGLAEVAAANVGSLPAGQARVDAAGELVEATRRVGAWTGAPEALPGGRSVSPSPSPSPSTSPSQSP